MAARSDWIAPTLFTFFLVAVLYIIAKREPRYVVVPEEEIIVPHRWLWPWYSGGGDWGGGAVYHGGGGGWHRGGSGGGHHGGGHH